MYIRTMALVAGVALSLTDRAFEFLFVLGQPLYKGSTQVNVNPVAIR